MNAAELSERSRILVVKLSSLGDIFHALPTAHSLRKLTGATLDWVVQDEYADLVRCFTCVDRVITTSRHAFFKRLPGLLRELRVERYDLVVDLQGLLKSAGVAAMARSPRRIAPSFHREGSRLLMHEVAGPRDLTRHAVDQALDVVRHLGYIPGPPQFPVRFPPAAHRPGGTGVALLPLSRWPSKNWPESHFAALAKRLLDDPRVTLYLLGSRGDAPTCARIAAGLDPARVHNQAGTLSMPELGGQLAAMDLLISNDSGPVHMAAAVGTPTLVLFGPTDPARTGPYGRGHVVLRAPPPCAPCYDRECRRHGLPCLTRLIPEQVLEAARAMLKSAGERNLQEVRA